MSSNIELETRYDPKAVEGEIYAAWEASGAFRAQPDDRPPDKRFVIMIPLPNVTGALHLGHAINNTLQDVQVRYHRMRGDNTLWQPGTDHAGIATQAVVEKRIFATEGKTRHDLGREELVRRIWEWKEQYQTRIVSQLKQMGCSCDWERMRFTLDEGCAKAVRHTFFRWFADGLIFRGKRLVNWDTALQTAVSDDEVYHERVKGKLTHIRYPIVRDSGSPQPSRPPQADEGAVSHLIVATTRPETMLGDTAVAVHPDDPRYSHLIGGKCRLPLMDREIPIIGDPILVDMEFGTGCVKVTPAHDPNDYDCGQRNDLEMINILTPDGHINDNGGSYAGLTRDDARKKVVADLEALDLIEKIEDYEHDVGHSDRSKTPVEPYLSDQWFVRMGDINEPRTSVRADSQSSVNASPLRPSPDLSQGAVLLTWTMYGTWLPGDERGFVSRVPQSEGSHTIHNIPGEPYDADDSQVRASAADRMEGEPVALTVEHSNVLLSSIAASAERHGMELLAVAIMTDHVHVLLQSDRPGRDLLKLLKGSASRELNERFTLPGSPRWFTRRGSTRFIRKRTDLTAAIEYVQNQSHPLQKWSFNEDDGEAAAIVDRARGSVREPSDAGDRKSARTEVRGSQGIVLGDGSVAPGLAQAAIDAVKRGRVKIFPERYTKTYLDWLGEKRDWCISRQLWWGHRIPVWHLTDARVRDLISSPDHANVVARLEDYRESGRAYYTLFRGSRREIGVEVPSAAKLLIGYWCPAFDAEREFADFVEQYGFAQDPDVLDTWFSSQLWPYSTLGWPDSEGFERELQNRAATVRERSSADQDARDSESDAGALPLPYGRGSDGTPSSDGMSSLDYYYPGSVLITSRDIITLWVARMVLSGLYNLGDVPFAHVYIHTKILDARGETMSKSKGNGVDPVDIIEVYGADALRYSITELATEMQDIRMPVDYRCPHCSELTPQTKVVPRNKQPSEITRARCGSCKQEFATQWADDETKQTLGVARETSDRFEVGRNFCNKIWNAARFAFMNLEGVGFEKLELAHLPVEDRWILAELSRTCRRINDLLGRYQFAAIVRTLRDFFWNSLCDWYIELTKARLAGGSQAAEAKQVLAFVLDQTLRLMHPVMPFITERLWKQLNAIAPQRGLPGLAEPAMGDLLITAEFPPAEGWSALDNEEILGVFEALQAATAGVRNLRSQCGVSPKERVTVTIKCPPAEIDALRAQAGIVQHLAGVENLTIDADARRPKNAASTLVGSLQIMVHDISDDDAERVRYQKDLVGLQKQIAGKESKLGNEKFVSRADPEIVEAERGRLEELKSRRQTVQDALALLGEE